ncbi:MULTISPECIES: bifunctional molybdenum cofactor biosynthesis protein MoaC/MoaB [unclassified Acinetobacter]|uniref:bifunctional molybdenum cofactor biosynthesis protein MoaC/MoaB n=1 Tax=unclassified Acinetobacter TaxID=196816 RepID=UPI00244A80DE|nr:MULTISPECIES: bifunctional molybdenum cofactor biosynthesis protein MoaC/MoaB [unclassified Acinetobacter]MDH0030192.1 bifunctional molybdenum cofactor biosynthesis protein MoaC/MoaB [Acinetobacter sp. GD04021]MDH0885760.1 bifunctional molybdenum cofactor biosynthesis protein MoaC/MoaB [Acinetobacter sp. GD03873]MDH1082380.1 bifunctional molybdenum cofactor biosynthesis protein MoaC/MoaB [Acinetobacter sp. GD03983]MDH2189228.1 bifunctional molybdenum cofactor biosynthesis protein MoaC/MoaB [
MKNVGMKPESYRVAEAQAILHAPAHCIQLLRDGNTEKGDALKTARIAGILAAKRTDELIPLCHPLPIYRADVDYDLHDDHVVILTTVETIGPTGVEMEALTAASLAGLTLYDMLKPHCEPEELCLDQCKLLKKKGGKSHFKRTLRQPVSAAVIVLSDTVAAGRKPDTAGKSVVDTLTEAGFDPIHYQIMADEADQLKDLVLELTKSYACIMTVGGTGIGKRDITVDTLEPLLERKLDGLMEAARSFGQKRTPYAAMSRGVAGFIDRSLVVTLPGSRGGASESMAAILPALVHIFDVCLDLPHPGGYE